MTRRGSNVSPFFTKTRPGRRRDRRATSAATLDPAAANPPRPACAPAPAPAPRRRAGRCAGTAAPPRCSPAAAAPPGPPRATAGRHARRHAPAMRDPRRARCRSSALCVRIASRSSSPLIICCAKPVELRRFGRLLRQRRRHRGALLVGDSGIWLPPPAALPLPCCDERDVAARRVCVQTAPPARVTVTAAPDRRRMPPHAPPSASRICACARSPG